jgi:hypothetical protein
MCSNGVPIGRPPGPQSGRPPGPQPALGSAHTRPAASSTQNAPCDTPPPTASCLCRLPGKTPDGPASAPPDQLFVALSRERRRGDLLLERVRLLPYA